MKRPAARVIRVIALMIPLLLPLPSSGSTYLETFRSETSILPNQEIRAAWVVRHALVSKEEIDRAIDYAVSARFQLLFVQVRGRGDAYYRSDLEPPGDDIVRPVTEFDPLEYLLTRAHEVGIAIHAWVNICYVWSKTGSDPPENHIVRTHPEWLMADDNGTRMDEDSVLDWQRRGLEGYFVSPAHPGMRRHTVAVIKDIVTRYPVDGVHLDYIRYPGIGFGFNDYERTAFTLKYGVDPLQLRQQRYAIDEMIGQNASHMLDSLYTEWRVAQIDTLVHMIREATGRLPLSAAVIPEFGRARVEKGQDWTGWVRRGDVDFVVPMAYTFEPAELTRIVETISRFIGKERFLVGLPVFDERRNYLGYSVSLLRQEGILGYALFSYNALAEEPFSLQFLDRVFLEAYR